jgi:creatinine amidohydrolase
VNFKVTDMTWEELETKANTIGVAIIPVGSTEQHGKHLPMETDAATAFEVACRVGERTGAAVFPGLNYGIMEYPSIRGVFLSENTFACLVKEVCLGVEKIGFKKILFISGHGPNNPSVLRVLKEVYEERPASRLFGMAHCMTLVKHLMPDFIEGLHTGHGDFVETSIMLAIAEKKVDTEKYTGPENIKNPFIGKLKRTGIHRVALDGGEINLFHQISELGNHGAFGHVSSATKEKGEKVLNKIADFLIQIVDELRKVNLS